MKTNKYHIVRTSPKCNRKIVETSKIDTTNAHMYDRSFSCLDIDTFIQSDGVRPVYLPLLTLLFEKLISIPYIFSYHLIL